MTIPLVTLVALALVDCVFVAESADLVMKNITDDVIKAGNKLRRTWLGDDAYKLAKNTTTSGYKDDISILLTTSGDCKVPDELTVLANYTSIVNTATADDLLKKMVSVELFGKFRKLVKGYINTKKMMMNVSTLLNEGRGPTEFELSELSSEGLVALTAYSNFFHIVNNEPGDMSCWYTDSCGEWIVCGFSAKTLTAAGDRKYLVEFELNITPDQWATMEKFADFDNVSADASMGASVLLLASLSLAALCGL